MHIFCRMYLGLSSQMCGHPAANVCLFICMHMPPTANVQVIFYMQMHPRANVHFIFHLNMHPRVNVHFVFHLNMKPGLIWRFFDWLHELKTDHFLLLHRLISAMALISLYRSRASLLCNKYSTFFSENLSFQSVQCPIKSLGKGKNNVWK